MITGNAKTFTKQSFNSDIYCIRLILEALLTLIHQGEKIIRGFNEAVNTTAIEALAAEFQSQHLALFCQRR